ncbi:MAG: DUF5058 family protein [Candidatus Izemoplasmatales bacterium]|jgi:hypothetical protein|nr:DUF5058 family protein [Candidatus Izemoplasmatales bacterium]
MFLATNDVSLLKEAWWMYLLGGLVTAFIILGSVYFGIKGYQQAKELKMPQATIKKTVISSISFSVLPSIGIFIGVITMAGLLGIPLPWIRLSVVGALHYELMAVSVASEGITVATMTMENFVTIAFAMTISIMWGGLFALFFFKKYQAKVLNKVTSGNERSFGKLLFDAVFIGMISAYLGDAFAKIFRYDTKVVVDGSYVIDGQGNYVLEDNRTFVPIIVFLSAMLFMGFLDLLIKKAKLKWLENFQLALSMLFGMTIAVLLGIGGIY